VEREQQSWSFAPHPAAEPSSLLMPKLPQQITRNSSQQFTGEGTTQAQHQD
jgi:hypothetical protein